MLKQRTVVPTTTAKEEKKKVKHQQQEQEERCNNNNNNNNNNIKNQNVVLTFFHQLYVLKRVNNNKRDEPTTTTTTTTTTTKCRRRLIIIVIFILIPLWWYISSIDNNNNNNNNRYNNNNNKPIWTSCPNNDGEEEIDSDNKKDKDKNKKEICFLTSIFGENVDVVDRPANVDWFNHHWCHVRFLLVTNLSDLSAPGWTKIVSSPSSTSSSSSFNNNSTISIDTGATATTTINATTVIIDKTKNNIIQSRHAKFLAWDVDVLSDIVPNHCAAIVYMDGYLMPVRYTNWRSLLTSIIISYATPFSYHKIQIPPPLKFQNIIRQVQDHPYGLSQVKQKYFDGLPMTTLLRNLVRDRKDTTEHVETTLRWFHSRTDFHEITPYYLNKYFAYDPNNIKYRELSSYFWETYTSYGGLWRDQPLWSYVLDHFNVTPAIMTTEGTITKGGDLFRTGGRLGWDKHVYLP
jgi:hypothetical protein